MGRIKSKMVKKAARELLETKNHQFKSEFEPNKNLLKGFMPSKKIRNKIAGYIARLEKAKTKEKNIKTPE